MSTAWDSLTPVDLDTVDWRQEVADALRGHCHDPGGCLSCKDRYAAVLDRVWPVMEHHQEQRFAAKDMVERVRHRHRPVLLLAADGDFNVCAECDGLRQSINPDAYPILWPCSTVRDLDGDTTTKTREAAA